MKPLSALTLAIGIFVAFTSCIDVSTNDVAETAGEQRLDVNDVSFLFPLEESAEGVDRLLPVGGTSGRPLLTQQQLMVIEPRAEVAEGNVGFSEDRITGHVHAYDQWRVVGARVDPCAKTDPDQTSCTTELRLVAQPIAFVEGTRVTGRYVFDRPVFFRGTNLAELSEAEFGELVSSLEPLELFELMNLIQEFREIEEFTELLVEDSAIHIIYKINDLDSARLIEGVYGLKAMVGDATNGQPLNIHPIMAEQGLAGGYAKQLKTLIETFATPERVAAVTIALQEDAGALSDILPDEDGLFGLVGWLFKRSELVDGELTVINLPHLQGDPSVHQVFGSAVVGGDAPREDQVAVIPLSSANDNTNRINATLAVAELPAEQR